MACGNHMCGVFFNDGPEVGMSCKVTLDGFYSKNMVTKPIFIYFGNYEANQITKFYYFSKLAAKNQTKRAYVIISISYKTGIKN